MYSVELITPDEKDELLSRYRPRVLYELRADIYGCCIKLMTDLKPVKERWEENFFPMSAHVRSHGRLLVTNEGGEPRVKYDPFTKTAFLFDTGYYGWVKSLALSVASDILEDEHNIYSVHGACVDIDGRGLCLIAPTGTGKTTHTYGLLRMPEVRVVSDDWFFVRFEGGVPFAFASERNFYIRADVADIWPEFRGLVEKAEFDEQGRAVVDLRWVVGRGRMVPFTTLKRVVIMKRDQADPRVTWEPDPNEALSYLEDNSYCNPHLLVRDERKGKLRRAFFSQLLESTATLMVNTAHPPHDVHKALVKWVIGSTRG
jgi:hypothetical protein